MTTWTIGAATVTRVEEQLGITNQPCEKYFRNFERDVLERHRDWLAPDHYSPQHDRFVTSVHSWLIRLDGLTILIDTCGGNHKERPWTRRFHQLDTPYLQRLRAAGAAPEDIDMVLCTHLHADHVGWNTMLRDGRWVPTFPNAKYLFSRTDDAYWDVRKNPAMATDPRHMAYADSVLPVVQSGLGVLVYAPHWNHMADERPADAAVSRRRLLESCAEHDALLFPIHFGAPHVVAIAQGPDGFSARFVQGMT